MKHSYEFSYKNLRLRPVHENDLEDLRTWRNEPHPFLSKINHITRENQFEWYEKNLKDKDCYTFAIEETDIFNKLIGSLSLYNFDNKACEFGRVLIGKTAARGKGLGFLATVLCLYIGFNKFEIDNVFATVDKNNMSALKAYEKAGFEMSDAIGENELKIIVSKENFGKKHSFLPEIYEV